MDSPPNLITVDTDADEPMLGRTAPSATLAGSVGDLATDGPDGKGSSSPSTPSCDASVKASNEELLEDEERSNGSHDADVIHIDLTERPPPLPMSGLALEQLVSMLPGSTYALSGSGVPMKSSPRSNARQHSPSARSPSAKSPSTTAAFKSQSDGPDAEMTNQTDDNQQDPGVDVIGEPSPWARSSGRQAAGSPRSPQVALTFVPGLGLVPVVIHDMDDDDEGDGEEEAEEEDDGQDDMDSDADGLDGAEPGAHAEVGVGGILDELAVLSEDSSSEAKAAATDSQSPTPDGDCISGPSGKAKGLDDSARASAAVARSSDPGEAAGASENESSFSAIGGPVAAGSSDANAPCSSPRLGTREQTFSCIFMPGLDLHESVYGSDPGDADLDPPDGVRFDSPERQAVYTRLFCVRARSGSADAEAPARQLQVAPEGNTQPAAEPSSAAAAPGRESEEYEDDLVDEEGEGSLDEVDDSGSGGGDEPDSILGGLGHARFGLAPDFPGGAAVSAPKGEHTSTVEASGLRALGPPGASASCERSSAAAPKGVGGQRAKGRVTDSSGVSGLQLPRARYVAHNVARSFNAAYGTHHDELKSSSCERPAAGHTTSAASEDATCTTPAATAPDSAGGDDGNSHAGSGSGGGNDLNSTVRMTGQSLAAIRQAAVMAEAQRQAKQMAERLGGGGNKGNRSANLNHTNVGSSLPEGRMGRRGAATASNLFGCAEQEASAAAGLLDNHGRQAALRRGGGGSSTGYAHLDSRQLHSADNKDDDDAKEVEEEEGALDLEDLLRDRSIIEPRYPTGTKGRVHDRRETDQHQRKDVHDFNATMEADESGSWRPRHRRSVDVVDLDMMARGRAEAEDPYRLARGMRSRSADGSPPKSQSLKATRKSDEGQQDHHQLAPPVASCSPRFDEGDSEGSGMSSSAQSVADERLVDELEALREELSQKTTLVAGLRGELRKYTDLAMRLEHQLHELRAQDGDASSAAARARLRSQSDAGVHGRTSPAPSAVPNSESGRSEQSSPLQLSTTQASLSHTAGDLLPPPMSGSRPSNEGMPSSGAVPEAGVTHTLPPHPQAQGLEGPARLALYLDILDKAQLQVGRCGGPAPPDLRDAQELLEHKESLDAGTEKVMLIKLRKMVTWGCEAAWRASVAQQQAKYLEHASQEVVEERLSWEAEREHLKQALEEALSVQSEAEAWGARGPGQAGARDVAAELRRQLRAAQDEAAVTRNQAADLESAVASLNADVRRLRSQLRSSRDGSLEELSCIPDTAVEQPGSRSNSRAWAMERKLLLSTITSLKAELEQVRAAASSAPGAAVAEAVTSPITEKAAKKIALAEAALEGATNLQAERDAALEESVSLRQQLGEALSGDAAADGSDPGTATATATDSSSDSGLLRLGPQRSQVEQLQLELAATRDALEGRTADAEAVVALHEQQSAELRVQLTEVQQQLALTADDLARAAAWRDEDRRAFEAEAAASAQKDALMHELKDLLLSFEAERDGLKAALSREMGEKYNLEETLVQARQALASALQKAEKADVAAEQQAATVGDPVSDTGGDESPALIDLEEALKEKTSECERLQQLVDGRTLELEALREDVQQAKEAAQAKLTDAQTAAAASAAELALLVREAAELKSRVAALEDELEKARAAAGMWRGKAEAANVEISRLSACVAGLQAESRDLRTALSAEDYLQAQLRGQVECLESELEAQACLAQKRGEQAAKMEAALAEAEHHRQDSALEASVGDTASAPSAELQEAQAAATAAQLRARELERHVAELQAKLTDEAAQRSGGRHSTDQEQRHEEAGGQRSRAAGRKLGPVEHGDGDGGAGQLADLAMEDRLRDAELACYTLRAEVDELRQQLAASSTRELEAQAEEWISDQVAALRTERVQLCADCEALQAELDRLRLGDLGRRDTEAQVEVMRQQLQTARAELLSVRAELQAALVELSVKAELMAAKDRSLATLQETVDALKLALQVTHQFAPVQNLQPPLSSPRRESAAEPAVAGEDDEAGSDLIHYKGSVAALQSKFTESESTIRRLEQQVAALETRISTDETASPTPTLSHPHASVGFRSLQLSPDAAAVEQQSKPKDEQARRLQESSRGPAAAATADVGPAVSSSSPRGVAGAGSADSAHVATINSLQVQVEQWRNMSEDLHVRYQSKKESVRRLREQLALEQKRRADEQALGQSQLEAASQRLSRLAMELGNALRRCITMDLHPLSSTALTTSPWPPSSGGAEPEDINSLAALLSRQGAALVESLEAALDQVNSVREERSLLTAQLSNRQAVLDELRHHLAHQAPPPPRRTDSAAAAAAAGTAAVATTSPPTATGAGFEAVRRVSQMSPVASPASPSSRGFNTAALSLSQDMAGLTAQQAGLRQPLQGLDQRLSQQPTRPRSMSLAAYPTGSAGTYSFQLSGLASAAANPSVSPLRSRSNSAFAAPESFGGLTVPIPDGSPPHAYVGIISGNRVEPRAPLGETTTGGGLHRGVRQMYGRYGAPAGAPLFQEGSRVVEGLGREIVGFRSPTSSQLQGSPRAGASGIAVPLGSLGLPAAPGLTGLGLSRERRIRLGEGAS